MPGLDLDRISPDLVIHKTWLQVISRSGANGNIQKTQIQRKMVFAQQKGFDAK